jgi:hypothetical protein
LGEPFTLTFDQAKAIGLRVPPSEPPMYGSIYLYDRRYGLS